MPTVQTEIHQIIAITQSYLAEEKTIELFIKLDEEVGKKSENEITKNFLSIIRNTVDKPLLPPPFWFKSVFYSLVILHILLVIGVFTSFFLLPFFTAWYIALPIMTFIWFFSTTKVECQLTNLENFMRKRLDMKRIRGFVGHYFLRPTKLILVKKLRKARLQHRR